MTTDPTIIQVNFRLTGPLKERLQDYCEDTGIRQSEVMRRAVIEYLDARVPVGGVEILKEMRQKPAKTVKRNKVSA